MVKPIIEDSKYVKEKMRGQLKVLYTDYVNERPKK